MEPPTLSRLNFDSRIPPPIGSVFSNSQNSHNKSNNNSPPFSVLSTPMTTARETLNNSGKTDFWNAHSDNQQFVNQPFVDRPVVNQLFVNQSIVNQPSNQSINHNFTHQPRENEPWNNESGTPNNMKPVFSNNNSSSSILTSYTDDTSRQVFTEKLKDFWGNPTTENHEDEEDEGRPISEKILNSNHASSNSMNDFFGDGLNFGKLSLNDCSDENSPVEEKMSCDKQNFRWNSRAECFNNVINRQNEERIQNFGINQSNCHNGSKKSIRNNGFNDDFGQQNSQSNQIDQHSNRSDSTAPKWQENRWDMAHNNWNIQDKIENVNNWGQSNNNSKGKQNWGNGSVNTSSNSVLSPKSKIVSRPENSSIFQNEPTFETETAKIDCWENFEKSNDEGKLENNWQTQNQYQTQVSNNTQPQNNCQNNYQDKSGSFQENGGFQQKNSHSNKNHQQTNNFQQTNRNNYQPTNNCQSPNKFSSSSNFQSNNSSFQSNGFPSSVGQFKENSSFQQNNQTQNGKFSQNNQFPQNKQFQQNSQFPQSNQFESNNFSQSNQFQHDSTNDDASSDVSEELEILKNELGALTSGLSNPNRVHLPQRKGDGTKHKPWMNQDILEMIDIRDKLYRRMKKSPQSREALALYKKARNAVVSLTRAAKRNYEKEQMDSLTFGEQNGGGLVMNFCETRNSINQENQFNGTITLTNSNQIHFEKQSQGLIPLPHQTSFYNQNGFITAPHERQNSDNSQISATSAGIHSASHNSAPQNGSLPSQHSISINSQNSVHSQHFPQNLTSPTSSNASSPSLKQKNMNNQTFFSTNCERFSNGNRNFQENKGAPNNCVVAAGLLNRPSEISSKVSSIWSPDNIASRARDTGASSSVFGFDQNNNAQPCLTHTNTLNSHNFSGWKTGSGRFEDFPELR